jgi:hypothetical protein
MLVSSPHQVDVGEKAWTEGQDYADFNSAKPLSRKDFRGQLGIIRCSA